MKKMIVVYITSAVILAGCAQPMTKTQKGAAIGTGVGAAAGAGLGQAIGGNTTGTLIGAGIGALVGGLTGGSVGRYMDNQEAAMRQQLADVEGANIQRNADMLEVTFKSGFLFDTNSEAIKSGSRDEISRVSQVLNQFPETSITIAGHTDSTGSETYNQQLSERRAMAVKNALIAQGVDSVRLSTVGYGEGRPIADNSTDYGRQINRRVAIAIVPRQKNAAL